jgi:predicted transcriptional regulator of viral defense system
MVQNIIEKFDRTPYFTIFGVMQLMDAEQKDAPLVRQYLSRWTRKGRIIRLKRGFYMTRRFFELHRSEAAFAPAVSAILQVQSYVSLEYVLQQAGLLTEAIYPVTSVTPKNTRTIENEVGTFVYHHLKSPLYKGFIQDSYHGVLFNMASPAKALFDYLYLRALPAASLHARWNLAEDLRLNLEDLLEKPRQEFLAYVEESQSPKMKAIYQNLQTSVWRH